MSLKSVLNIPLAPYTPKPGDGMDSHAEVRVERDSKRREIRLTISCVQIGDGSIGYRLGAPFKRIKLADSMNHAPKMFESVAGPVMNEFKEKRGPHFDQLVQILADQNMKIAE